LRNGTVFTLQTDIGEIDLPAEVTGLGTFEDVKQHSITVEAFDRQIATLDPRKRLTALAELESLLEAGEL
jgi:Holliday junction resolvase-like predicted endonuclease